VFRSDAEALAAAEKAYRAYRRAAETVLSAGGTDSGRLVQFATGRLLSEEQQGDEEFKTKGYHAIGTSRVVSFNLQRADLGAARGSKDVVAAYVCLDVSKVDVVDAEGQSVVSTSRSPRVSYLVGFDLLGNSLLPSSQEPWDSGGVCG
jgi:hypothetical protein